MTSYLLTLPSCTRAASARLPLFSETTSKAPQASTKASAQVLPMSLYACLFLPMSLYACLFLPMSLYACLFLPMSLYAHVYFCPCHCMHVYFCLSITRKSLPRPCKLLRLHAYTCAYQCAAKRDLREGAICVGGSARGLQVLVIRDYGQDVCGGHGRASRPGPWRRPAIRGVHALSLSHTYMHAYMNACGEGREEGDVISLLNATCLFA
jgi:hypothetical protein